jgi:hypothetical protein
VSRKFKESNEARRITQITDFLRRVSGGLSLARSFKAGAALRGIRLVA